jgi:hypothetical protein
MNTQTPTLNRARTAALIDPTIELSYGNPGEKKRLPLSTSTKPNSNSNPEIREFKNAARYSENCKRKIRGIIPVEN